MEIGICVVGPATLERQISAMHSCVPAGTKGFLHED